MAKHEFNVYASTKTSAQLFLDLAATVSHGMTLYIILSLERRDMIWSILFYSLIVTIAIQAILAVGLFTLRLLSLRNGSSKIPRAYKVLNDIFFWGCLLVAALEVGVAAIEKFGLGHSYNDPAANNGSFTSAERTISLEEQDLFK
jgi:hypothetical protein